MRGGGRQGSREGGREVEAEEDKGYHYRGWQGQGQGRACTREGNVKGQGAGTGSGVEVRRGIRTGAKAGGKYWERGRDREWETGTRTKVQTGEGARRAIGAKGEIKRTTLSQWARRQEQRRVIVNTRPSTVYDCDWHDHAQLLSAIWHTSGIWHTQDSNDVRGYHYEACHLLLSRWARHSWCCHCRQHLFSLFIFIFLLLFSLLFLLQLLFFFLTLKDITLKNRHKKHNSLKLSSKQHGRVAVLLFPRPPPQNANFTHFFLFFFFCLLSLPRNLIS